MRKTEDTGYPAFRIGIPRGLALVIFLIGLSCLSMICVNILTAQQTAQPATSSSTSRDDATALSKATQNPVGDLTSIPLQFNFYSGGDLVDRARYNFNFQPVVPVSVGKWKLILRTIVPYLDLPAEDGRSKGIGDVQQEAFLTPGKAGSFTWGLGPILQFPTATNDLARTGDWAAGPGAVVVANVGPFVLGGLITQVWTFAGDDVGPNVNQFGLQPFINYNLPDGWAISMSPQFTANWSAESGQKWTVPIGGGFSKVVSIGRQPMSLALQYYNLVKAPDGTGRNVVRFVSSFLFPNKK